MGDSFATASFRLSASYFLRRQKVTKKLAPNPASPLYLELHRELLDDVGVELVWQGTCSLTFPWAHHPVPEQTAHVPSRWFETRTVVGTHFGVVRICKEGL
jgi:hypothetical protein